MDPTDQTVEPGSQPPPHDRGRRLERPRQHVIAGVAGAVSRELGIDVRWVRIAFVLLVVFGGAGIALYGLGILLIPEEGKAESFAQQWFDGNDRVRLAGGVIVLLLAFGFLFGWGGWWRHGLFPGGWVLIVVGLLLLFGPRVDRGHQRRGDHPTPPPPPPPPPPTPSPPSSSTAPSSASLPVPYEPTLPDLTVGNDPTTPSNFDATTASSSTYAAATTATGTTAVSAGLDDATSHSTIGSTDGGAGHGDPPSATAQGGGPNEPDTPRRRRRLRILGTTVASALVLLVVGLIVAITTDALPVGWGWGDHTRRPETVQEIDHYRLFAGDQHINLTQLPLRDGQTVTVRVDQRFGNIDIDVPTTARVRLDTHVRAGEITAFGLKSNGWTAEQPLDVSTPKGWAGGPTIVLKVHLTAGDLDIERGVR